MNVSLKLVACCFVTSFAFAQNVGYNPGSGTQDNPTSVNQGSEIKVKNDLDVPILVQPRESNGPPETGTPIGDPFIVLANSTAKFTVPNSPALLGMPFELDPNTSDDQLLGQ